MGAALGNAVSRVARVDLSQARTLAASTGGAGLAVAFGAPLAGLMFVLEEVDRSFRTQLLLTGLVSVCAGTAVAGLLLGHRLDLPVAAGAQMPAQLPLHVLLGVVMGAAGVGYNRLTLRLLDCAASLRSVPPEVLAASVGGVVALTTVADPRASGEGGAVALQLLTGTIPVTTMVGLLALRWVLGPLCYAVGTPGGIFAPLLAVGALAGSLLAAIAHAAGLTADSTALVVTGMVAFFAGVVRAPITGAVLLLEMTGAMTLILPVLTAAAVATATADLLGGPPIYDSLRDRLPAYRRAGQPLRAGSAAVVRRSLSAGDAKPKSPGGGDRDRGTFP